MNKGAFITKDGKQLRCGFTTGSCAAAAAKAAAWRLLTGTRKDRIEIVTPKGIPFTADVVDQTAGPSFARCAVAKDSGDDPDVTDGMLIYAEVSFETPTEIAEDGTGFCAVTIDGGEGIGRVTKPGLDQKVGAPAINSVPQQMIRENVEEICRLTDFSGRLHVRISAPEGEERARKTFNERLGIVGGISILGTTGIVEPMSEQALVETIRIELRQRKENGAEFVLLTPGNYGAAFIRGTLDCPPDLAVMTSNYIGDSLVIASELGFRGAIFIGHIGKMVKLAGGMMNTHSKYGDCRMEILSAHAGAEGLDPGRISGILGCVSCDEAIRILDEAGLREAVLARIGRAIGQNLQRKAGGMKTGAMVFSNRYGLLCSTDGAEELLAACRKRS